MTVDDLPPTGIGVHGLGRIGRSLLRRAAADPGLRVRAVNDRHADPENLRYLLEHDSVYGRGGLGLTTAPGGWAGPSGTIRVFGSAAIDEVDWTAAGVGTVIDASGAAAPRSRYENLVRGGVERVIVTNASARADLVLVPGVNEKEYDRATHRIVAASTCDGSALAPVLHVLHQAFGVHSGFVTTLHPALSYQNVLDAPVAVGRATEYQLGRASGLNLIPKETSAVATVEQLLPALTGRLGSLSFRVPTPVVTCASLWLQLADVADRDAIRSALTMAVPAEIVGYTEEPVVSSDFTGDPRNAVISGGQLAVSGRKLRLVLWYDNEAGYAAHVLRVLHTCAGRR